MTELQAIFAEEHIDTFGVIPFSACRVIHEKKLARAKVPHPRSAIVFLIPYFSGMHGGNISLYAVPRDYHLYFKGLTERIVPRLEAHFGARFCAFSDNSPIDERAAALDAGLGVRGRNGLLLNEKYSSFAFIGELFTDADLGGAVHEAQDCHGCGACLAACPSPERCLSEITQTKTPLSEDERALMRRKGTAWGCDACQLACPFTKRMLQNGTVTPIPFFKEDLLPSVTTGALAAMDEDAFAARAFAWRGRAVIERNAAILEEETERRREP